MKLVYITGGLTPYRIAFCDSVNQYLKETGKGQLKLFLLTNQGFNSNYDNSVLMRPYAEFLPGKTLTLKDSTTRFMINPDIARRVKEEVPDFIILGGSWTHPSTWILLRNKKKIGVPIYFWAESHFHNGLKRKQKVIWKEMLKKFVYDQFDGFFAPGTFAIEAIKSTKCKNSKNCIQLPNLIENEKYERANEKRQEKGILREQYGLPNDKTILFTPSRLVDIKGLLEFLENGKKILCNSKFLWLIAGIGPLKNKIEGKSQEYGIDVRLLGFIDQNKVIDYLAMADYFLLPSLSDPNPLSVIEALWAGMPLVLSKYVGNYPETLLNGENGILFDTLSKESVNKALDTIQNVDSEWLKNASEISRKIALDYFDMKFETRKLLAELEKIILFNKKR